MAAAGIRRPRSRTVLRVLGALGMLVLVLPIVAATYAWNLGTSFDHKTTRMQNVFPEESLRPPSSATEGAQTILLLGSDTGTPMTDSTADFSGQHSDTILVAHVPADRKHIYSMSIPRDTWVEIPGHGEAAINTALALGGVPLAVHTVEGLLGIRMDHVAVVDFGGFEELTEELGGVSLNNPAAFESSLLAGHTFAEGRQHVNGPEALAFMRERHAFGDGDFERVRNQQLVMKALLDKTLSGETLANPVKLSRLVNTIAPALAVDEGLSSAYLAKLGFELRGVRSGDVSFFTMPTNGFGTSAEEASTTNIDWEELASAQPGLQEDARGLISRSGGTTG